MLGKRNPTQADTERDSDPNSSAYPPKNMMQIQFLLDKYMHSEKLLQAKTMELQHKDQQIANLKNMCDTLSQRVMELEFDNQHLRQNSTMIGRIPNLAAVVLKPTVLNAQLKDKSSIYKVNKENSRLKDQIAKSDYQVMKLKQLLDGFFVFCGNIVQTVGCHQFGIVPPHLSDLAHSFGQETLGEEAVMSPESLSLLLTKSYSLVFDEQTPTLSEATARENSGIVAPSVSASPSPEKLQKTQSEPLKATVEHPQTRTLDPDAYQPPASLALEMELDAFRNNMLDL